MAPRPRGVRPPADGLSPSSPESQVESRPGTRSAPGRVRFLVAGRPMSGMRFIKEPRDATGLGTVKARATSTRDLEPVNDCHRAEGSGAPAAVPVLRGLHRL